MERKWYSSKEDVQMIVDKLSNSAEELNWDWDWDWDWNSNSLFIRGSRRSFAALVRISPSSMSLVLY
jgi:hypothetical protein